MKFHMQLLQVKASQVAQLDLFQVLPQPFHRVEVRRNFEEVRPSFKLT